jgi:hypothetical protein
MNAPQTPARRFARYRSGRWQGFMAVEALGALVALAFALVMVALATAQNASALKEQAASQQLRTFHQAADAYVRSNFAALVTASAGGPVAVSVLQLANAGVIDPSVSATGYPNAFGQTPVAWIRSVTCAPACPNRLQLVSVTRGGETLSAAVVRSIATRANGAGTNAGFIVAAAPTGLVRVYGAGTVDLAPYAALGLPGAGRVGAVSFFDGSQLGSDFLARSATGNLEDNRMRTGIDMSGNAITNGGDFTANDFRISGKDNAWASSAIQSAFIAANGTTIPKPTCPRGAPAIYTAISNAAADNVGTLWSSVQTWAVDNGASWNVNIRVRTAVGWVNPADGLGNILALVKCD